MRRLSELIEKAKEKGKKSLVVVGAEDEEAVEAAVMAKREGLIGRIFLVGNLERIKKPDSLEDVELVESRDEAEACEKGVKLVSSKSAEILLKGLVKTSTLLKAVLNKEWGLRGSGLLTHLAAVEVPALDRVVFITDGGIVIRPSLEEKVKLINNAVEVLIKLGCNMPKVALICAVETVNPSMPETMEAAIIAKMNQRGEIKGCIVDGPLGLDNALSLRAAEVKGIKSPVAGCADLLVVPDIHSGNFLGKSAIYFAAGKIAGIVVGAKAPVVLVSRADTSESKLFSIAMACAVSEGDS